VASILGVPGKNGMREYIEDVWEESKYTKPLEITRRFANNETLTVAGRVKCGEMKPFERFIHFLVMKNVIQDLGRETLEASWIDVYGSHDGKEDHELPYGDWLTMVFEEFGVPLVDKKGEERSDMTILRRLSSPCASRQERMVFGGLELEKTRRRDDVVNTQEEEDEEEGGNRVEFDWESLSLMRMRLRGIRIG
ncbi:hypothetical protein Dimus_024957, partial [Dionaea muscipula]